MSSEAFLAPHFVIVENEVDEVDIAHRDTCERIERDGYFEYACGVGYQIDELGFTDATCITNDGVYLLKPWFVGPQPGQDADFGMEVIRLIEARDAQ